jgi:hypothetical protein
MLNSKRTLALTATLTLLAVAPAAARPSRSTHKYTSTVTSTPVSTSAGYPQPGSAALFTGTVTSKQLGAGTLMDLVTVYGKPKPNVFALEGAEVDRLAHGRVSNTFTGTDTVTADGSQKVVVHGTITGGTHRYKGARGHYTFTGAISPGATILRGHSHGKLTY